MGPLLLDAEKPGARAGGAGKGKALCGRNAISNILAKNGYGKQAPECRGIQFKKQAAWRNTP
jgi:hypothetical protein